MCVKTVKAQSSDGRQEDMRFRVCEHLQRVISNGEPLASQILATGDKLFCAGQVGTKLPRNNRLWRDQRPENKDIDPRLLPRGKEGGGGVVMSPGVCSNGVGQGGQD